jgi:hypothetical protein
MAYDDIRPATKDEEAGSGGSSILVELRTIFPLSSDTISQQQPVFAQAEVIS